MDDLVKGVLTIALPFAAFCVVMAATLGPMLNRLRAALGPPHR